MQLLGIKVDARSGGGRDLFVVKLFVYCNHRNFECDTHKSNGASEAPHAVEAGSIVTVDAIKSAKSWEPWANDRTTVRPNYVWNIGIDNKRRRSGRQVNDRRNDVWWG